MDGQATEAPGTVDDLAQFLVADEQAASQEEEEQNVESTPAEEQADDDSQEDAQAEDEQSSEEEAAPTRSLKFKVPVKGDDGADSTIEVDEKELIAGYQRQADYTRKTQELATQREEVTRIAHEKAQEGLTHFMQQANTARAAVLQLAGLKTPQELAQLAQTDPAAAVQEQFRAQQVYSVLGQIEQAMQAEQSKFQEQQKAEQTKAFHSAWGVLGSHGIDKPKLQTIFEGVKKHFNVEQTRLDNVSDPRLVLIFRDAVAYRDLQERAKAEGKKAPSTTPSLPPAKQRAPQQARVNKQLNDRFRAGKADRGDLSAYLLANKL